MNFSMNYSFEEYKYMVKFLKKNTDITSGNKALVSGGFFVLIFGIFYIGLVSRYNFIASVCLAVTLNIIWTVILAFQGESDKKLLEKYNQTPGNKEYTFTNMGFTFHHASAEVDVKETFPYQGVKFALAAPVGIYIACLDSSGNNYEYMIMRSTMDEAKLQELDRYLQANLGHRYIYFYNRRIFIDKLLKTKAIVSDPYIFQNIVNGKRNEL